MQEVVCYNCQGTDSDPYAVENGFNLVKCRYCGLLYVNPRPAEEEIDEALRYGMHKGEQTLKTTGWYHPERVSEYVQTLGSIFPDGFPAGIKSWLDIGCGHGEFLAAIRQFGGDRVSALGIEPNRHKQMAARKRGLNVKFFDLASHNAKYDAISILNVFSHLPDPPTTLGQWLCLLKPGGILILQTGDTANLTAEMHYRPFYLPDHLSFASEAIVTSILSGLGLRVETVHKYPFIRPSAAAFVRETIKLAWPSKSSKIRYLFRSREYVTDMYVLARAGT